MYIPKVTYIVFGILTLLAFCLLIYTGTVPVVYLEEGNLHPMTYPRFLLVGLMLLFVMNIFVQQVSVNVQQLKHAMPLMLGVLFAICLFIGILPAMGFLLSSIVMSFLILKILRYKNSLYCLCVSVCACTFFWYVFKSIVLMPLPVGTLTNL